MFNFTQGVLSAKTLIAWGPEGVRWICATIKIKEIWDISQIFPTVSTP